MNRIKHARRFAAILAGLASALLAFAAGAPGALAMVGPHPDGPGSGAGQPPAVRTVVHTVVVGGMPGWQIALIAVGSAVVAAVAAALIVRARAVPRNPVTVTA
jgi:hypothetical protein